MQWEFIVALVLGIPVVLFPVVFLWYLNIGGIYSAIKEARSKKAVGEKGAPEVIRRHGEESKLVGTRQ